MIIVKAIYYRDGYPRSGKHTNGGLSPREWQTMELIVQGKTPQEAIAELKVTRSAFNTLRDRVMKKTGCRNNVELALQAYRQGLVQ